MYIKMNDQEEEERNRVPNLHLTNRAKQLQKPLKALNRLN